MFTPFALHVLVNIIFSALHCIELTLRLTNKSGRAIFAYSPQLDEGVAAMFGSKKTEATKAKVLTKKGIFAGQIEQLGAGQSLSYITSGWSGDYLIAIEINPRYPKKGKKYLVSIEELAEGKASGKRQFVGDSNKPHDMAGWIINRKGELFHEASAQVAPK